MPVADEDLARWAAQGDKDAFGVLVERHQRFVFNLCLRTLGDYDIAAETAQDVFLRAWRAIGSFRGESKFSTWLYTVAHNLCMNRGVVKQRDTKNQINDEDAAEELLRLPSREEDPAVAFERKEGNGRIHRQIELLPERYRVVITLFYLQELSYQEIADVTGLPIGTVKTHLFRAKDMLRRSIEDELPPESVAADGVCGGNAERGRTAPRGGASFQLRAVPVRGG